MLLGLHRATRSSGSATAALLHDVGKLAIPLEILRKDGTLDDAEWHVMAQHPVIGEGILRRIPQLAPLAPIVRHEHEHWDGSGYPDGLARRPDPDRLADHPRLRRVRGDDHARPYRRALPQPTRSSSCAPVRARSSTRRWSRRCSSCSAPPTSVRVERAARRAVRGAARGYGVFGFGFGGFGGTGVVISVAL